MTTESQSKECSLALLADAARNGSAYWPLFEHMSHEHNLTLLDSEMEDICQVVLKMRKYPERDFEVMLSRIVRLMDMSTDMGQLDSICAQARGLLNRKGTGSPLRSDTPNDQISDRPR